MCVGGGVDFLNHNEANFVERFASQLVGCFTGACVYETLGMFALQLVGCCTGA